MSQELHILELFEAGNLPEEISYLYRMTKPLKPHPFKNVVANVEPVKSPSTGRLSTFIFESATAGVLWIDQHPSYNKHEILSGSLEGFLMEIDDLEIERDIELESISLWVKTPDGWQEHNKPLSEFF